MKFTPKVPDSYKVKVTLNVGNLHQSIFIGHVQVKERRLEVVGELDLKVKTLQKPSSIAVNSEGLITVADYHGHCILLFDKEGNYLQKFGYEANNVGQLKNPADVTFVNDGEILVADELNNRMLQFITNTGEVVKAFGKMGAKGGGLHNPAGTCKDGEGRVAVADRLNNRM